MNAPKVTVTPMGLLVMTGLVVVGYMVYKLYHAGGALADAFGSVSNNIAGALVPDANAPVQSNFQQFNAAWNAAGRPAPGSPEETALRVKYNIPLAYGAASATGASSGS